MWRVLLHVCVACVADMAGVLGLHAVLFPAWVANIFELVDHLAGSLNSIFQTVCMTLRDIQKIALHVTCHMVWCVPSLKFAVLTENPSSTVALLVLLALLAS